MPSAKAAAGAAAASDTRHEAALQPWQFFLLGGMLAATAVVIVATGQAPANIIVLSITVVSISFVGMGAYRMLSPLVAETVETPPTIEGRTRIAIEREKHLVLRSIKELEFDYAMHKIAKADFDDMSARLRARAAGLIKQLDSGGYRDQITSEVERRLSLDAAGSPASASGIGAEGQCANCQTQNDPDAKFCKNCGSKL